MNQDAVEYLELILNAFVTKVGADAMRNATLRGGIDVSVRDLIKSVSKDKDLSLRIPYLETA